ALWNDIPAARQPLERVERIWRGVVMDTYTLEKLSGWTPELSPPPNSPLFRWRVLAMRIELRDIVSGSLFTLCLCGRSWQPQATARGVCLRGKIIRGATSARSELRDRRRVQVVGLA